MKSRSLTRAGTVEEFILRDLKRHIDQGGTKFKFAKNNSLEKGFKGLKIKDLTKGDIIDFAAIKKNDPRFKEYKKVFNDIKKLKLTPYINPVTKEKITLLKGLQEATGVEAPLHIQHGKGVATEPLKNLSIATHKANIGAKMVGSVEDVETLGVRSTIPGGKRVYGPVLSFEDEINRLTKWADRKILQTEASGFVKPKTPTETLNEAKALYQSAPEGAPIRKYLEKEIANCADGCFIKVANKNPERITKKLVEDPKLIRLFRGEPFGKSSQANIIKDMAKRHGVSEAEAGKKLLQGQWFSSDPMVATGYTNKLGKLQSVDVTPKEFLNFKKYVDRVNKTKGIAGGERFPVNTLDKLSIVPRYKLDEFEKAGKLKTQRNIFKDLDIKSGYAERPPGVLTYDSVLGGFVDSANPGEVVGQNQIKTWAEDNPIKVEAGTELPKANKSVLKTVGKTLAHIGAPLPTALIDSYFINKQIG